MLVEIDEDAEAELRASVDWYEEQQEGVGLRFMRDVEARISALPNLKLRPLPGYQDCGAMFVEVGGPWPYRIVVVKRSGLIRVVAFSHDRREPGYWRTRLAR